MSRSGDRGQSAPLGVALLLGLTILGTTAVVAFGSGALTATEGEANIARAQQSMTQFDSQTAQVALGDAAVRTTTFGRLDGDFSVNPISDPDSGQITITHVNYDGTNDEQLYTGPLGAVVYEQDGTTIAYQGGGVWQKAEGGGTRMVSPPEFHYRQGTLTFPIIQTTGSGAVSGSPRATVSRSSDTVREFPDGSVDYPDGTPYVNTIDEGYVTVTVESEYYEGWAEYFRARTDGTVTVDDANEEVTLELDTLGYTGPFGMPSDPANGGGSLPVQGIGGGHALTDFQFRVVPKDDQESGFSNLRWSMYVNEGNQKFEMALRGNGNSCGDTVDLFIYYSDDSHATYEGWHGSETIECSDTDGDSTDEYYIDVDLVDATAGPSMNYDSFSGSDLVKYKNEVGSLRTPGDLPSHGEGDHSDESYSATDQETRDFIVSHYFAELGPNFELRVSDQQSGNAAGIDESSSEGYIDYTGGGRVVTYLHITENEVEVELD
jgi:hypothetical protein